MLLSVTFFQVLILLLCAGLHSSQSEVMEAAMRVGNSHHSAVMELITAVMRPGEGTTSLDVNFSSVFHQSDGMLGCGIIRSSIRTIASSCCTLLDCSYCVM